MRFITVLFCTLLIGISFAWTEEDREIFDLQRKLESDLGAGETFYTWLGIPRDANDETIQKAYRKLSRKIHPDKNPSKKATARFTRLGLVNKVLRGPRRERYDFFLNKGFPKFKGSDYFYARYRPGLGFVLIFLYLVAGGLHFLSLKLSTSRHRAYMESVIEDATHLAYPTGIPSSVKRVNMPNGKQFSVYPDGRVCLFEEGEEYLLNTADIHEPTWKDTLLYRLPVSIKSLIIGRGASQKKKAQCFVPGGYG